jgi:hypothetical protein
VWAGEDKNARESEIDLAVEIEKLAAGRRVPTAGELWMERVAPATTYEDFGRAELFTVIGIAANENGLPYVCWRMSSQLRRNPRATELSRLHAPPPGWDHVDHLRTLRLDEFLNRFTWTGKERATGEESESDRLWSLLALRHEPNEWALFKELQVAPNGGGRRFDMFAVHCWRSQGFHSVAYEVKTARSDFLRELKQPDKRLDAEKLAHECWFVVTPGVCKAEEVPESWGLLIATEGGLKKAKVAVQRQPEPWPTSFVVSMARRATDADPIEKHRRNWGKAVWALAGRVVDEDGLQEFCKAIVHQSIAEAVQSAERLVLEDLKQADPEYRELRELQAACYQVTGRAMFSARFGTFARAESATPAAALKEWAEKHAGTQLTDATRHQLKVLRDNLDRLLTATEKT